MYYPGFSGLPQCAFRTGNINIFRRKPEDMTMNRPKIEIYGHDW